ncbi:MAG: hypothetical protein Q4E45_02440, partial [Eubacteriales bacterium]|nr:hypothetical protein [Eubacteriales bacterium]
CASREIGANQSIRQAADWRMKPPPAASMMIRVPARHQKKAAKRLLFFGAPAGTRTPDTLLKRPSCLFSRPVLSKFSTGLASI